MHEEIWVPIALFATVAVMSIGIPLARGLVKRWERESKHPPALGDSARLERIEQAIDAMAVEVERIAEGQRFVTRLMAEREQERVSLPPSSERRG